MKSFVKTALVALALGASFTSPAIATEKPGTMLVLDASGSMWGQIDGVNKITIARDVVGEILSDFPADQPLGFVTYGHRERGQCSDIQTIIEPAPDTAHEIIKIVNELNPRGMTPMTDAVIAAAQSLRHTEQKATVILISDGIETCNPDPCAAARALADVGIDFTAHVIGFDVKGEAEALMQMQCIAEETGGRFLTADNADELSAALQEVTQVAVAEILSPGSLTLRAVLDNENGPEITDPIIWNIVGPETNLEGENNPLMLSPKSGVYSITGYHVVFEQTQTAEIAVVAGTEQTVNVVFETSQPQVELIAPDSAPAASTLVVGWRGDNLHEHNIIGVYNIETGTRFSEGRNGGNDNVSLLMPSIPGTYELRYYLGNEIAARKPLEVTPVDIRILAPQSAPAASYVEVSWTGLPEAQYDLVRLRPVGQGGAFSEARTRNGTAVSLLTPSTPGTYELAYEQRLGEPVVTALIEVTPVDIRINAPATITAGSEFAVSWTGLAAASYDLVRLRSTEGGSGRSESYTRNRDTIQLRAPDEPGAYEIIYLQGNLSNIVARLAVTVTPEE